MREAHPIEQAVGMEWYVSDADGTGGRLRASDEDFRVREIERFETEPVDAAVGGYPHVVLRATLHGWDTNDFAARLSDGLGVSRERVSWAGTKDKHAVTTQLFSVRDIDPDDVPEIRGADIEVLGRSGRSIEFGDLVGNEFEIVVSDADSPERADAVVRELREFVGNGGSSNGAQIGVPNYFGQQRFGSQRPVTHEVGLHVVREEWEEAVLAYVGNPSESEPEGTQEARALADDAASGDRDWQRVLEEFPQRLRYERSMLHSLVESGGTEPADFREALETVPSNLQRLFVHAAQSYAFNRILSERLARGLPFDRPIEGDVACFSDRSAPGELVVPDTDRLQRVTDERVETMARHCERGRAFVTAPLVGTETELAEGEQGEIERDVLADLDLEPADFDLPGEFDSTGTRRAVLVRTELDAAVEGDDVSVGFALPKGSYATVVLREFLKAGPLEMG
ncbi:tRNA pseudouridine13 synthase [Natronoarchaeum philippinense]|uniref:Probable tRNA pseudouridine synthase D n=1 Tax=Natronoarchaeum philippinense TaxID=558529 RepID=A0A285NVH0_NATPI|nr:tRNA pseudouridine(13) synthase TruD [Natronoarchaeum philippinense]SNZ13492.1 tRNA pseudouridine13 synthase [Natronoarchaeum philippinense]